MPWIDANNFAAMNACFRSRRIFKNLYAIGCFHFVAGILWNCNGCASSSWYKVKSILKNHLSFLQLSFYIEFCQQMSKCISESSGMCIIIHPFKSIDLKCISFTKAIHSFRLPFYKEFCHQISFHQSERNLGCVVHHHPFNVKRINTKFGHSQNT